MTQIGHGLCFLWPVWVLKQGFTLRCVFAERRPHRAAAQQLCSVFGGKGRAAAEERGRRKVKLSVRRGERSAGQLCNQKALTDAFSIRNPHRSSGGTHRRPAVSIVRHWCWRLQKGNVNPTITVAKGLFFFKLPSRLLLFRAGDLFFFFPLTSSPWIFCVSKFVLLSL